MIGAILLLIVLGIYAVIGSVSVVFLYMPYVSVLFGTGVAYAYIDALKWIPGHPVLSLLSILLVTEGITFFLLHRNSTCKATVYLSCSVVILLITMILSDGLNMDSWQFALVCTLIYAALAFFSIAGQLGKYDYEPDSDTSWVGAVVASLITAGGSFLLLLGPAGLFWERYFYHLGMVKDGMGDKICLAVVIAVCVAVFGVELWKIKKADTLEI
ncbi:hypothetical protein [Butyrivibrio sp. INlla14]|uniref:hypothetical protein n=1 Tax=Butyrivibrio sp. INlla14 TaxID=1520808 RepID=UPI000876AFA9|nr:hypothetical protein [Butyrivibrio sp. INlla14]SCY63317.1 hypothetical protein SAMN02910371_03135 [Butyrivibrio sp. INlla14]